MNSLVYHIASGHAFFTGIILLIAAVLTSLSPKPIARRLSVLAILLGGIAVAISSTAIPYWSYVMAVLVTVTWLLSRTFNKELHWARAATIAVWIFAGCLEIPNHIAPSLSQAPSRTLAVIGDSVTAGMGGSDKSEKWPAILAKQHDINIQDISHVGETASSALKRAREHQIESPVLLLEIGGNDLLGRTTVAEFEKSLDALLEYACLDDRQVIMFELPLPPFFHEYGRVQRSLARKYEVSLVPKRVLLSVLAGTDSTLDTIHLSQAGHQRMADCVWRLVRSAFVETDTE